MDNLIIFVGRDGGFDGWLHLADGAVAARGAALEGLPVLDKGGRSVAVVPGEEVAIHWLELPGNLAPAQATAAARLIAADVSAQPIGEMHVAVGPQEEGGDLRCIALAPVLAMTEWLARLQAHGVDPDMVVAEPLLLQIPDEGLVRYPKGDAALYRGSAEAFVLEPHLAEIALAGSAVADVETDAFEAGLAGALDTMPVNLRQGLFAKRRRWTIDWRRIRRLVQLAIAILIATIAVQVASILRYTYAADALEAEIQQVAVRAIPGGGDDIADLDRRLAQLRGGGVGYSALVTALFGAVQATANAELTALSVEPDGSLRATVQADTPATLAALTTRLETGGFSVDAGTPRISGGRQLTELTVRPR